ncbi:MAG: glycosyl hydrolase [Lewinellaceae bacterium]|nr:glycosyl hydrolase [Lewinellaceae bacterium]
MVSFKRLLVLPVLLLVLSVTLQAQKKTKKPATTAPAPAAEMAPQIDAKQFKGLKWRNIGPFRGGRANAITGVPGNDKVYFMGGTGSGVWKTEDGGLNWRNVSDGFFKTATIGDIAVAASDPNVIYVGTGEHAVRGVMTTFGDGVYKSTDGGATWKNVGLEKTRHISDVIIHPNNPDVVYVAAQGAVHGPTEERGIYRSMDGGATWKKVLYVDENTGASSLSMDFQNPRILYAATWQHIRRPWIVESGGPGSGLWKSSDGGDTWNKINEGLPKEMGKIGVSVSRANSSRVYAIIEAEKSKAGVYRSDNGGKSWQHMTNDQTLTARSWYYMEVFADPVNADIVYVLNAPATRSIDGGKTFTTLRVGHGDTHDLYINPENNQNIALADDGGGEVSYNQGGSWSPLDNQPTAQFYRVNADNRFPYWVYGGQQDNSSVMIMSRTNSFGITEKHWFPGAGCESAYLAFDPNNPELVYGGCYQGYIEVLNTKTMESKDIMAYPALNLAVPTRDMKYRFNWNAPIVASPHDPKVIYHAGNKVLRTTNGGMSWTEISPDLTRNETAKQGLGGGPITNEGAGGENYNTIYYLIESTLEQGVIWTGSDCGLVHVTRDNGKTWQNVTPPNLPECMIHSIELSPHDKGTAYVSATRVKFNDFRAMAYKTTDYGKTWTAINQGINTDDFLRVIREDKQVKGLLYGGAERGFYVSTDGGAHWYSFQLNLPVVTINDLIIRDNDLVAATAGRAFWILDDLGAIQQTKGVFGDMALKLFTPKATYRYGSGGFGRGGSAGQNPLEGVVLDFYLKQKPDSTGIKLEIMDNSGKLLRTYSSIKDESFKSYPGGPPPPVVLPAMPGVNRFNWDLRTEALPGIPGVFVQGDTRGRRVGPGRYRARLSAQGQTSETEFEVLADPALAATAADWAAQQDLLQRIDDQVTEIHESVNQLRKVRDQLKMQQDMLNGREDAKDIVELNKAILKKMEEWEGEVIETRQQNFQDVINWPSKINGEYLDLKSRIDSHDPRLTNGVKVRMGDLDGNWNKSHQAMQQLLNEDIPNYNRQFQQKGLPAVLTNFAVNPGE